jgi:hypothetical protein
MRKILRDTCIFAALMILTVFAFSIAGVGFTEEIKLVFELFGLAFILAVINYIFDEKTSFSIIVGYLVKYLIVSVVVIAFGFIVGWFYPSNFWMAFIYVGVITVIVYALDSVKTEKDIEEINEMVKLNKNEKVEFTPLKKRKGWKVLLVLSAAMALLSSSLMAVYVYMTNGNTVSQYSGYCLNGFIISLVAAVFLLGVLAVYFIVYSSRRKKNI